MAFSTNDLGSALQSFTLTEFSPLYDEELGRGAYGRVFKVKYKGKICAAKEIHALLVDLSNVEEKQKIKNDFLRECHICSQLDHANIVRLVGIYYQSEKNDSVLPVMVMELMGESLTKYVKQTNITMKMKISILNDVALGLDYLHHRKPPIVHRDLSPNNILMSLGHNPVAKISDLGVAKIVKADSKATKSVLTKAPGTVDFMPPEGLVDNPTYDTSLDVFSYAGIILHVINQEWPTPTPQVSVDPQTGKLTAFTEVERRQVYINKIKDTNEENVLELLVKKCLDIIPSSRPTMSSVLKMLEPVMVMVKPATVPGYCCPVSSYICMPITYVTTLVAQHALCFFTCINSTCPPGINELL